MKSIKQMEVVTLGGRSPCGERGLKYDYIIALSGAIMSLPVRGAWIEIKSDKRELIEALSLPVRGAWIEISAVALSQKIVASLPVRGAWIEITSSTRRRLPPCGSLPVRGAWIEILSAIPM